MSFQRVSAASELWPGEMKGIVVDGVKVVLINADGTIYAYADRCAHRGVPLSTGEFRDGVLVCTVHYWEYDPCTGCGINPQGFQLVPYTVKVENGDIWVDVQNPMTARGPHERRVGPVLQAGPIALAVVEAIRALNRDVGVEDRGSYVRVSCPERCVVSRAAIEERLHHAFVLPGALEQIMPSFKGFLHITDDAVSWDLSPQTR